MTILFSSVQEDSTVVLIRSFANLPDGWHYGEGCCATKKAVENALAVNSFLLKNNARKVEAFPDVDGGILVSGYNGNSNIEILCSPIGQMDILHESDDEAIIDLCNVSLQRIEEYLGELAWPPKKSFVSFIRNTSVRKEVDSRVSHLEIPLVGESLQSIPHAQFQLAEVNAIIFEDSTQKPPDFPRSFGGSIPNTFQNVVTSRVPHQVAVTTAT